VAALDRLAQTRVDPNERATGASIASRALGLVLDRRYASRKLACIAQCSALRLSTKLRVKIDCNRCRRRAQLVRRNLASCLRRHSRARNTSDLRGRRSEGFRAALGGPNEASARSNPDSDRTSTCAQHDPGSLGPSARRALDRLRSIAGRVRVVGPQCSSRVRHLTGHSVQFRGLLELKQ
jgi:hypothetical protein